MGSLNDESTQRVTLPTAGRFTVLNQIGQGGMGVLFKGFDPQLNRPIALKFLKKPSSLDPESEMRFLNEARAAAALDHPNVCTVYDIGAVGERVYIAMAYIEERVSRRESAVGRCRLTRQSKLAYRSRWACGKPTRRVSFTATSSQPIFLLPAAAW